MYSPTGLLPDFSFLELMSGGQVCSISLCAGVLHFPLARIGAAIDAV